MMAVICQLQMRLVFPTRFVTACLTALSFDRCLLQTFSECGVLVCASIAALAWLLFYLGVVHNGHSHNNSCMAHWSQRC